MIYILDNEPATIAQWLDDKSLYRMIKDIAQVLCNAHYFLSEGDYKKNYTAPLPLSAPNNKFIWIWSQWARECKANYNYLVKLSMHCCVELMLHREILKCKKYQLAIDWASTNLPDLPSTKDYEKNMNYKEYRTPFPLVIPKKYHKECDSLHEAYCDSMHTAIESYRNYYQAKLKQRKERWFNSPKVEHFRIAGVTAHYIYENLWTQREKPEWLSL